MDAISGSSLALAMPSTQKQALGGQVVDSTMSRLNTDTTTGRINPDYGFQTKVLGAQGLGTKIDIWV